MEETTQDTKESPIFDIPSSKSGADGKKVHDSFSKIKNREVEEDCEDNILPEDRTDESDEEDETSSESED